MNTPLWSPTEAEKAQTWMTQFTHRIQERHGLEGNDYAALHRWSTENLGDFWAEVWEDSGVIASAPFEQAMGEPRFPGTSWFAGARLNFAENLLAHGEAQQDALRFIGEDGSRRVLTYAELRAAVHSCAQGLKAHGVGPGDRVAAVISNAPEAVIGLLAAASLGAIWSSCSPDFGISGIHDRLGQIEPQLLITVNAYLYNGKEHDCLNKVREVAGRIPSIQTIVVVPFTETPAVLRENEQPWDALLADKDAPAEFAQLPFAHPLAILYSSGTTGLPKSIVHAAGGVLLKHLCEHRYHVDLHPGDRFFYYTTCGWMMWNWLVSGLASGVTLILYDGAPTFPEVSRMWKLIEDEQITHFGTSPKFLGAVQKSGYVPKEQHTLSSLRAIMSTGSTLPEELFDWVYRDVADHMPLMSISGGTDLVGCLMLGNPNLPVFRGEIQCRALGLGTEAFSPEGQARVGEKGELVCTTPFPSMPVFFWNDPDNTRYRKSYFERFPGVWTHGDFIEVTERGGVVVYGRSDTILNPGGVRIGTAEIYRPVEALEEVVDSIVIGQPWEDDVRIVLFVVLRPGDELSAELERRIRQEIRTYATPRHLPSRILAVADIPRTISGKKVEKAVLQVLQGETVENTAALANPEALSAFQQLRASLAS